MTEDIPTFEELVDWVEGRLPADKAKAIADYVESGDKAAQEDVAWIQTFLAASKAIRLDQPPAHVRETLRRRFESYAEGRQSPGVFQRLIATLTFDSGAQPAPAGIRSAATEGMQRQLIFTTDLAEVALNIQPRTEDKQIDIIGQVFASREMAQKELSVQLLKDKLEVGLTNTDELGEFSFEAIPAGEYELIVSTDEFEIVLKPIHLEV